MTMKVNYLLEHHSDNVKKLLDLYVQPNVDRLKSQKIIYKITRMILNTFFDDFRSKKILLVPVVRAGVIMWMAANTFFRSPETSFILATKDKSARTVETVWWLKNALQDKEILFLDTVIATSDTISAVCQKLHEKSSGLVENVHLLACFASSEAIEKIRSGNLVTSLTVASISQSVDHLGYLVPSIGGDAGDKLFGSICQF